MQPIYEMTTQEDDEAEYRAHHVAMFGHDPVPGEGKRCCHPQHTFLRRVMNGAEILVDFDPQEVIAEDSWESKSFGDRYASKLAEARSTIKAMDEQEKYQTGRDLGLILPN